MLDAPFFEMFGNRDKVLARLSGRQSTLGLIFNLRIHRLASGSEIAKTSEED